MFAVVTWTLDDSQSPIPTVHGVFATEREAREWGDENDEDQEHDWHVVLIQPVADSPQTGVRCLCSKCSRLFLLTESAGAGTAAINISSCASGGVYGASVTCPHCRHEHDLM